MLLCSSLYLNLHVARNLVQERACILFSYKQYKLDLVLIDNLIVLATAVRGLVGEYNQAPLTDLWVTKSSNLNTVNQTATLDIYKEAPAEYQFFVCALHPRNI